MKLSEAIRLGAMTGPQIFGKLIDNNHGSCAIGAALVACGRRDLCDWPWSYNHHPAAKCPVCEEYWFTVASVALHLNDRHEWRREQIASWIEQLESQQDAAVRPPVEIGASRAETVTK